MKTRATRTTFWNTDHVLTYFTYSPEIPHTEYTRFRAPARASVNIAGRLERNSIAECLLLHESCAIALRMAHCFCSCACGGGCASLASVGSTPQLSHQICFSLVVRSTCVSSRIMSSHSSSVLEYGCPLGCMAICLISCCFACARQGAACNVGRQLFIRVPGSGSLHCASAL